ncbi:MAG: imidazole glycerol phosphate synthase subunit HisH [Actinobacteria bacterium]|nr:imidazole glycerol phosphate synthase subunit HisH [Actinomycetota bacterium]
MTQPRIAVLDYGIGNLRSAQKALEHVGARAELTSDAAVARAADAVVLPGVGAFGACMDALRANGLEEVVHESVASGKPFIGICVGMQMLFDASEEDLGARGLGVIPGNVKWVPAGVPRPQMQWNRLSLCTADPMFDGLGENPWMYFVHSLHGVPNDASDVAATVHYGSTLNVAFRRGNVFATQFHPEKSATAGLALLGNFVKAASR